MTWDGLEKGQLYVIRLKVRLADGSRIERQVVLRGGWQIQLPLLPPDKSATALELLFGAPSSRATLGPDGRKVAYTWGREIIIQDLTSGRQPRRLHGTQDSVASVAFSPDGRILATGGGGEDRTAVLWDVSSGQQLQTFRGHSSSVITVAFSDDGRRVLTGSYDDKAILWDTASGKPLQTLHGYKQTVRMAAFTPDGKQVLTAGFGFDPPLDDFADELMLWDADTGKLVRKLHDGRGAIRSIVVSPDRCRVLTALSHYHSMDQPGSLTIWDLASGRPAHEFSLPDMSAYWAFWSPDGREIITTGKDGVLLVVSADTGKEVRRFANQSVGHYYGAGISVDGRQIVARHKAGLAVWDSVTGRLLHEIGKENTKPRMNYSELALSPDGRQLLAVTESNLPGSPPQASPCNGRETNDLGEQ